MKLDAESGSIGVGKRADLLILHANPLENISNIRRVAAVVVDGRMFEPSALWRIALHAVAIPSRRFVRSSLAPQLAPWRWNWVSTFLLAKRLLIECTVPNLTHPAMRGKAAWLPGEHVIQRA